MDDDTGIVEKKIELVSYKMLLKFYIPLALATLSMQLTHLLINIALSKMPNPDLYISSYSIAMAFAFLLQTPVMVFSLLITTYVVNIRTYKKVIKFNSFFIIFVCLYYIVIAYTPIASFVFHRFYNLDDVLLDKSISIFKVVIFFSMVISIREQYVGTAMKIRQNQLLTLGSVFRLGTVAILTALMAFLLNNFNNDIVPGLILVVAGVIQTLVIIIGVHFIAKNILFAVKKSCIDQMIYDKEADVKYKQLLKFSIPLMVAFIFKQIVPSVTRSALALTDNNIKVIAAYTIASSVIWVVMSIGFSYPHLLICFNSREKQNKKIITSLAFMIFGFSAFILFIIGYTSVGDFVFINIMNAVPDTAMLAKSAFKFMFISPLTKLYQLYYYGYLIKIKKTNLLMFEQILPSIIPYSMFFFVKVLPWDSIIIIACLMMPLCDLMAGAYNHIAYNRCVKKGKLEA